MIIGGWALNAHQFSRATYDVDCMIATEDNARFAAELASAGFECFDEKPAFRRYRHRLDPLVVLDVMRVDAATFSKMLPEAKEHVFLGVPLHAVALRHLIALKLHASRQKHRTGKDMFDVISLLEANPGLVSPDELRDLCSRYGSPETSAQLTRWL